MISQKYAVVLSLIVGLFSSIAAFAEGAAAPADAASAAAANTAQRPARHDGHARPLRVDVWGSLFLDDSSATKKDERAARHADGA